jgi:hypothetical protein
MRQIHYPSSYKIHVRDLDIEASIERMRGSVLTEVTEARFADDGILMVDTDKKVNVKINNTLYGLSVEDSEIKFKEIK